MKKLKSYIITSVISLLCIFFIIWSKGIFNKTETKDVMLILTDAFFAVGAVVAGFGLLVVASNGGTLPAGATTTLSGAHTHSVTGSLAIPALSIASSGGHTHTVPSLSTKDQSTKTSGGAGYDSTNITAVNVQNPYIVVYMYKRIG